MSFLEATIKKKSRERPEVTAAKEKGLAGD
jgi:hypothetical protein